MSHEPFLDSLRVFCEQRFLVLFIFLFITLLLIFTPDILETSSMFRGDKLPSKGFVLVLEPAKVSAWYAGSSAHLQISLPLENVDERMTSGAIQA